MSESATATLEETSKLYKETTVPKNDEELDPGVWVKLKVVSWTFDIGMATSKNSEVFSFFLILLTNWALKMLVKREHNDVKELRKPDRNFWSRPRGF